MTFRDTSGHLAGAPAAAPARRRHAWTRWGPIGILSLAPPALLVLAEHQAAFTAVFFALYPWSAAGWLLVGPFGDWGICLIGATLAAMAQYPVYAVLARRPISRKRRQVLLFLAVAHLVVGGGLLYLELA